MEKLRKIFVVSVIFVTVLSMSAVAAPAGAASASAGDLIKMDGLSSVYYLGADNKRYVFPNQTTYLSWYSDFSKVKTIPQRELESYGLGANVTIRPGTKLVKITTDPKVYAVEPGGKLRHIPDEATAKKLYGDNWAKRVVDVPDSFFTNYKIETPLGTNEYPAGSLIQKTGDPVVYYYDGTNYRKIASEAAFIANRFNWDNILKTTNTITAGGAEITGAENAITDTSSGAGGTAGAGTGLTVALSANTPAAGTVPSNAVGVVFTRVNFTASNDGDTTITNIVVKRSGVGPTDDLSKVYLYDGVTRLTTGRTIGASTNEVVFNNVGLVIPKGTTKTISIVADVGNNKTGNHALGIAAASAITTNGATVSGSFPVTGNTMSLSATSVGKVDVESNGSNYTRRAGEVGTEIANFTVYVNNTEDAKFKGITIYNSGRDVLSNLKLYRGNNLVATAIKNGSNFVFTLDTPFDIAKGQSASFVVKGDVSGRNADTATLYVRYNTDVVVTGNTYGYNLGIDNTLGGSANSSVEESDATPLSNITTVQAGQLTAAFIGPNASDVSKNTNKVKLLEFSLTSQATVDVSKMTVVIAGNGNLANTDVDNLELVVDSIIVGSKAAVTIGDNVFTDTFTLPAGKTVKGQVNIDINNTAAGNETITASLKDLTNTANFVAKTSDGDTVTDIIPSGNITGKTQTVVQASLTINRSSSPAGDKEYVKGTSDVQVVGFTFAAGAAADVKVTSIKLTAYLDDTTAAADFGGNSKNQLSGARTVMSSIGIYDGNTLIASKKALSIGTADITVTFDGLNLNIPKGTSKNLVARVDLANALVGGNDDYIALTIAVAGDVSAEYGNGTNLTANLASNNNTPTIYQKVTGAGTLTMVKDANTPSADLVVAGTQNVVYTRVKFSTTKEAFKINKLRVINSANDSNFDSITVVMGGASSTQSLTAGIADFNNLGFVVPKDGDAVLIIYGNLNTITGGAVNGNASTLGIDFDDNLEAEGVSSGDKITTIGAADIVGNTMTLFESIPTVAFASDTPSGNLIPSANTLVGKINITAHANKDISFVNANGNQLVIKIDSVGAAGGATDVITVKDKDGNTLCTKNDLDLNSDTSYTCDFGLKDLMIAAGTTHTISVYLKTTKLSATGNSVQIWLDDNANNNIKWGINGVGDYATGAITFRGDKYGGSLVKP